MKTPLLLLLTALTGGILWAQSKQAMQPQGGIIISGQPIVPDCGMVNGVLVSKPCKQYAEELAKRLLGEQKSGTIELNDCYAVEVFGGMSMNFSATGAGRGFNIYATGISGVKCFRRDAAGGKP